MCDPDCPECGNAALYQVSATLTECDHCGRIFPLWELVDRINISEECVDKMVEFEQMEIEHDYV